MSEDALRSLAEAMPLWSQIVFMVNFGSVLLYAITDRRDKHRAHMRSLALDDESEGSNND